MNQHDHVEKATAISLLLQEANAAIAAACHAVPVWDIPGFYFDVAGHTAAKRLMEADVRAAYTTALAYRVTGNAAFADKTRELLLGWARVNTAVAGADGPLVSAYLGVGLILAAEQLKAYTGWTADDHERFASWMTQLYLPEWERITLRNNWWDWSLYARLALFRYLNDQVRLAGAAAAFKAHIDASLSLDGFIPEETLRGRHSVWYHYFALAPATAAARIILDATGEDLFRWTSPGGKSLKTALDRFFYYMNDRIHEWPYDPDPIHPEPLAADTWPLDLFEAMYRVYGDAEYGRFVAPCRPVRGNTNKNTGYYQSYAWVYPELLLDA